MTPKTPSGISRRQLIVRGSALAVGPRPLTASQAQAITPTTNQRHFPRIPAGAGMPRLRPVMKARIVMTAGLSESLSQAGKTA